MPAAMNRPAPATPPLPNSYWVVPGQVLAGEYPAAPDPDKTRERLKRLLDAGIECFIDLTQPDELPSYEGKLPEGIDYLRRPIEDHSLPASPAQMMQVLESITESVRAGRPVYVHCRAGIGRTGTAIGCLLVERGFTGDQALEELNALWQKSRRSVSWPFVPETEEQAGYVRNWIATLTPPTSVGLPESLFLAPSSPPLGAPPAGNAADGRTGTAVLPRQTPVRRAADATTDNRVAAVTAAAAGTATASTATNTTATAHVKVEADPLLEPTTLAAARGLRGRFLGSLVGLAIGDAVAAATQYKRRSSFTPVGDLLGGGPFDLPRGGWSDDTAMTLCLAESLLACNGFDARDQVQRFIRWQQEGHLSATGQCVGITANTARALAMSKWRRQVFPGSHDPDQLDVEPLSRVAAPVMFSFATPELAVQYAADAARTTCQAPIVLDACRTLARVLHAALEGKSKADVLAAGPHLGESAGRSNGTAPAALASAIWAFATTDNFRDAVLKAANVGGNSDVVAAICGQIAGAFYGVGAVPGAWRNSLMHKDVIENFADRLLQVALVALSG
jgi:ADP-ribosyl-[dinitrogen reductase] hydrolase